MPSPKMLKVRIPNKPRLADALSQMLCGVVPDLKGIYVNEKKL